MRTIDEDVFGNLPPEILQEVFDGFLKNAEFYRHSKPIIKLGGARLRLAQTWPKVG